MSNAFYRLANQDVRDRVKAVVDAAPEGSFVEFKPDKRTAPQNNLMWEILTTLSDTLPWHGETLTPPEYKDLLTAAFRRDVRLIPNVDGDGFVAVGSSTSRMRVEEASNFIEFIFAFGASRGVKFFRTPEEVKASVAAEAAQPPAPEPERPAVALAEDLTDAPPAIVLAWADLFEATLAGCPIKSTAAKYWTVAKECGRLRALQRVDPARLARIRDGLDRRFNPQQEAA